MGAVQAGNAANMYIHDRKERGGGEGEGSSRRKGNMKGQQPAPPINDWLEGGRDLLLHDRDRLMELQAPDKGGKDDLKLENRKAVPDAVARPVAERDKPAPSVRELAGWGNAAGHKPARGIERRRGGAPDVRVDVHRREWDVEDLARVHADRCECLA